ncbi:MAG: DUF6790 family protein [Anaerolineales bacterium]
MTTVVLRILMFTLLPVILAWLAIQLDKSADSSQRRLEVVLILLFAIGVAGNGIFSFFGHLFLSDIVAESIGWQAGSPFQLEMGFANLAIGVLGLVAVGRRDGFREATVIAATILGVGATVVHLMDILTAGNLAPGNTLQNVGNLARPALLIWGLTASRRAEASARYEGGPADIERWREPFVKSSGPVTATIATAYAVGFATGHLWLASLVGAAIGFAILTFSIAQSPGHSLDLGRR